MFKGYIFLQFYVDQFQMQHSYRGKTSQQCEVSNASCIREGSIKLACHPPYRPKVFAADTHTCSNGYYRPLLLMVNNLPAS